MSKDGDPTTSTVMVVFFTATIGVFVIMVALLVLYLRVEQDQATNKIYAAVPEPLSKLRSTHQEQLNSYRWIDQQAGAAAIPIDEAMAIVVRDFAAGGNGQLPGFIPPPAAPVPGIDPAAGSAAGTDPAVEGPAATADQEQEAGGTAPAAAGGVE